MLGVQLAPQLLQQRGQDRGGRVGPGAVDGVPVALGVLCRLRRVLLQHAGPALDVAELAAGQRAVLERREQPERLGVGVRHHGRVQQQDGPVRARRAVVQRDVRVRGPAIDHRSTPRAVEAGRLVPFVALRKRDAELQCDEVVGRDEGAYREVVSQAADGRHARPNCTDGRGLPGAVSQALEADSKRGREQSRPLTLLGDFKGVLKKGDVTAL